MAEFTEQTVIVTGGASGIGLATAVRFRDAGARVVVGDVNTEPATGLGATDGIEFLSCDVQVEADVERLIAAAADTDSSPIRVVVNNAGVGLVKQIPDVTAAEWDRVLNINFRAAFFTAKHAIPHLRAAGGGSIVNVSSNAGLLPRAHDPVYSTSKGALVALTKSLALCHAGDQIRVNCVCPGPVERTGMMEADLSAAEDREAMAQAFIAASPLARAEGRMIGPEEVAAAIVYLASEQSSMVTGTAIAIDGGKSLGVPPPA